MCHKVTIAIFGVGLYLGNPNLPSRTSENMYIYSKLYQFLRRFDTCGNILGKDSILPKQMTA